MKKIIALALSIAMLLSIGTCVSMSAYGATSADKNFEYEILDDGTVSVTKYLGKSEYVGLPAKIDGYDVTEIGDGAFRSQSALIQVYCESEIRSIGDYAFADCTQLSGAFAMSDSLKSIGAHAFENCEALGYFDVCDNVKKVGAYAFSGCTSMYALYLGMSLEEIGEYAYNGCVGLDMSSLVFPESVSKVGANAFANIGEIDAVFLNSECAFEKDAFIGDTCVIGGYVGSTAEALAKQYGFEFTDISVPSMPDDFTYSVSDNGTAYITEYNGISTNVIIPEAIDGYTVTEIRSGAFSNPSITKITIADTVEVIEKGAFNNCVSLKSIYFGSNLKSVDTSGLNSCTLLNEIIISESNPYYVIDDEVMFNYDKTELVFYPRTKANERYIVPDTVKVIGDYAFSYNESLKSVVISNNVEAIGEGAFNSCIKIDNVAFGSSVVSIGDGAFAYCKSLKSVVLPNSVRVIADSAFNFCDSLEEAILGYNIETIGDYAFEFCGSLKNIDIPSSVTELGSFAFDSCTSLESVKVGNGVKIISYSAFSYCSSLKNVELGSAVEEIAGEAFSYCGLLKNFTFPRNTASVGRDAFYDCKVLENIYVLNPECDLGNIRIKGVVYGLADSTAQKYATQSKKEFVTISAPKFSGASVILYDDLTLIFRASKSEIDGALENEHISNAYSALDLNGVSNIVAPVDNGDKYSFACADISPNLMADRVDAKLYITIDGVDICVDAINYGIADYAYSMLEKSIDDKLNTLLVDMLNYGAQSQLYTDYKTNRLANSALTDEQKSFGTAKVREFTSVLDTEYQIAENQEVKWLGAGLRLDEAVQMRFKFSSINNPLNYLTMKITDDYGREYIIPANNCVDLGDNSYYIYFNGLDVGEMSKSVYITMYANGKPVSNTLCYSIESYAALAQDTDNEALKDLTASMMLYGDSAHAYAN